jgi:hypothetical protein
MSRLAVLSEGSFRNQELMRDVLNEYHLMDDDLLLVIGGGSNGSALWIHEWAFDVDVNVHVHFPKLAKMDDELDFVCKSDILSDSDEAILFCGRISNRVLNAKDIAEEKQIPLVVIRSNQDIGCEVVTEWDEEERC